MIFKNYYKILGLESNKVSSDQIKTAYRELAKKYHPDMNANVNNSEYEEIFKDINEAYRTLSNPSLKRKYDFNWNRYYGKSNKSKQEKKSLKEIFFELLFGNGFLKTKKENSSKEPIYGEDITTKIDISIQDAFYGVNKQLKFKSVNGKTQSFSFKIPAGIQNHDKIRFLGKGKKGKNGGKNGDLLIEIDIKDEPNLKLSGIDLYTQITLKPWEAALGTTKIINVLDENMQIIIPKSTSSSDTLTIKQKGYKNGLGSRGDLKIVTKIVTPRKLSKEQIELYQKLKQIDLDKTKQKIAAN